MGFEMSFWWYGCKKEGKYHGADIAQLRSSDGEALHLRRDFLRSWEWEWLDKFSLTNYKLTLGVGAMLKTIPGKYDMKIYWVKQTRENDPWVLDFGTIFKLNKWWPCVWHWPSPLHQSVDSGSWCRPVSPDSFTNAPTGLRADGEREGWHI